MTTPARLTREERKLSTLMCLLYFASYITRVSYMAIISQIVLSMGFQKSAAALATTALFISYGLGQLVSGYAGDRYKPDRLIFLGLLASSALNAAMVFCTSAQAMAGVWFLNGFAQAMLWPPLLRIITLRMSPEGAKKATANVAASGSAGAVFIYLLAPVCIAVSGWRLVFLFSAVLGGLMALIWLAYYPQEAASLPAAGMAVDEDRRPENVQGMAMGKAAASSGLALICLAIAVQGILRDGVSTWMPSFIIETLDMGSSASILSGAVLPLFGILSVQAVSFIYRRLLPNEVACALLLFGVSAAAAALLAIFFPLGALASIASMAVITGSMHGVNLMLVCMIPARFERTGKISTVSGIVNACTYAGSAVSAYGVAKISEALSWRASAGSWAIAAAAGIALCLTANGKWKKFIGNN